MNNNFFVLLDLHFQGYALEVCGSNCLTGNYCNSGFSVGVRHSTW